MKTPMLIFREEPLHAELGREVWKRPMRLYPAERIELARDEAFGLGLAPTLARVAVDFVQPPRRGFLDANRDHGVRTDCAQ